MNQTLTPPQLAEQLGVDVSVVRRWIISGELPASDLSASRRGRPRYRILPDDADRFLKSRQVSPVAKTSRRRSMRGVKKFF